MANDASNHPTNSSDADMNTSGDHTEFDAVQLAQANAPQQPQQPQKTAAIPAVPNGTVHVEVPQGEKVVRVAVANGETVVLPAPFDDQAALAAKEGNGNLAIRVGDVTVILEGYQQTVDASGNPTVTLQDPQGDKIDIAVVLASTDPNLDIETAAGPAAGAQGADNTGALLSAFDGAGGLGGLNAVGVLDATALQYKLIDNAIRLDREDELTTSHPLDITVIGPQNGLNQKFLHDPVVKIGQFTNFTYDEFISPNGVQGGFKNTWADYDGTEAGQDDMHETGEIIVNPHNDSVVDVRLNTDGLQAQNLTSNGVPLYYVVSQDGTTIFGFRGDGTGSGDADGALVLVVHVQDNGTKNDDGTTHFVVDYFLVNRIDDLAGDSNGGTDSTHLNVNFDVSTTFEQTGTGTTGIDYIDDAPIAKDDTDSVANFLTTDGNVETGLGTTSGNNGIDKEGADGATVTNLVGKNGADNDASNGLSVKGEFGTLVMNADGTYTYTRDNGNPTLDKDGKTVITLQDKFTYTLTDDDGDKTTANLTIDIRDNPVIVTPPPPPGGGDDPIQLNKSGTAVFESGLPDGSKSADDTETTKGSVKVDAKDGVDTVTVGGTVIKLDGTPTVIAGKHGDITVTWDKANNEIDYTYTLKDNDLTHSKQGNDVIPGEDFKVEVTDKDGDKGTGDINIVIVDDVPNAENDTDKIDVGELTQTGNVITGAGTTSLAAGKDTLGADGATVSAVVGAKTSDNDASNGLDVQGQYGKLHIEANGDYTYTRDPGSPGGVTDVFIYTLKDGDGDIDTATLTITVGDDKPEIHVPTAEGMTTVYEKGLPQGSGELADGDANNKSDQSEVVNGTVTYKEGDAPASITIIDKNGNAVTVAAGVDIAGADGTLHINSVGGGNINYTYTLTNNDLDHTKQGNDVISGDSFKMEIVDKDGDKADGTLVIKVVDDVPDAKNDTDLVDNKTNTATGNVVTGTDTTSGATGADVKGADGATVSKVEGQTTDADPTGGFTVQGKFGTLQMAADGTYTYTRFDGKPLDETDTFTYTLKDGDGDTDTATLVVTIKDNDIKIKDLTPEANGGDVTVDEDGLSGARGPGESAGSDGSGPVSSGGDFTITSPDGVQTLTIGGHEVITNGVFTASSWTTGFGNTISITGYDPASGKVTYTYTLTDNEAHLPGNGENNLFENLAVTVTDKDGDQASDTLSAKIVDDVPTAKNDTDVVDNATNTATGNVVTGVGTNAGAVNADIKGADDATVTGLVGAKGSDTDASNGLEVQGNFGKLVMAADGTYTYTRDPGTPGGASDTFTYTLTDKDGDTSTATLIVGIDDKIPEIHAPTADGMTKVYEKGLEQGSGELADGDAKNKSDQSEVVNGTITYKEGDAPAVLTITDKNGNAVTVAAGVDIVGKDGTLHINSVGGGNVSYTYTLTTNDLGHSQPGSDVISGDSFKLSITDKDGDNATDNLVIKIVDDVPDAKNDTDLVDNKTNTATGNVVTGTDTTSGAAGADVKGADGAVVSQVVGQTTDADPTGGFTVQGKFGTLQMAADGTYTYTRFDGKPIDETDTFTYTLKDGDGDTDTATLVVTIKDNDIKIKDLTPEASGGDVTVDEDGLSGARGPGESAGSDGSGPVSSTGDFTITSPDGVQTLTIGGVAVITNGVFTATSFTTAMGNTLNVTAYDSATGKVTYSYTLNDNETHLPANGENNLFENLAVTVTDKDGDQASDTLSAKIVDDVPTAKADTDLVDNNTNKAEGNAMTGVGTTSGAAGIDVPGADGAKVTGIAFGAKSDTDASDGLSITGQYGTLTMKADGTYTYTRFNGDPLKATETFNYTLTDGDGDTSTTTLKVTISDEGCNITDLTPKTGGGDTMVDEDGLLASRGVGESAGSDGSGPTKGDGDFTINAPDGVQNLSVDGHAVITNGVFAAASWTTPFGNTISVTGYDANTGKVTYNYVLNDNESHSKGDGENSLYEDLNVSLTDKDGDTANGTLSVKIVDDVPVGTAGDKVLGTNPEKNNVLLVLDITGSMGVKYPTDQSPTNKLQFEVQAAKNLLDAYLAAGNGDGANLRVQIVTFSLTAQAWTTQWVDIQEAKEILNQIGAMTPNGTTNYDAGIQQALGVEWTPASGAISGASNSTYFFSDGLPNQNNDGQNGLNGTQATAWFKELNDNDIKAYAIGMVDDLSAADKVSAGVELGKIAYDGTVKDNPNTPAVETDDPNKVNDAILVTDPNSLTAQIVATIVNKGDGNIVGDLGGKYGADGGTGVNSITLNGKTYTFDGVNAITTTGASADTSSFDAVSHLLTITTSIGKFTIDMDDGKYTYQQKGGVETAVDVGWTIIDKDGDVSNQGTLHLLAPIPVVTLASDPDLPVVGDFNAAHKQIGLNDSATLNGNGDGGGDYLDGTFGNHTMNGGKGDDLYVVNGNDTVQEKYHEGHDTVQSSVTYTLTNAVEDLVLTGANNINGTGNDSDNAIVGNTGNNTLSGGGGNDVMIGGAGADTMKGDAGNDQFLHVDKADLTSGGVNGGDGDDLVDLSGLTTFKSADGDHSKISNVEILSFTGGNAAGTQVALDYNSVLTMTDANNNLVIHGDQGKDTVALSGGFTKIGTDVAANDGAHYDVFQAGTGANLVTVFVDHNLNATAS